MAIQWLLVYTFTVRDHVNFIVGVGIGVGIGIGIGVGVGVITVNKLGYFFV
jgi:hypothetical protein